MYIYTHTCAKLLQSCLTLCKPVDHRPLRLLFPWDSPGKHTDVGCHALLQGICPTQGLNLHLLCLLLCRLSPGWGEPIYVTYIYIYIYIYIAFLFFASLLCVIHVFKVKVLIAQSYPTLCEPVDYSHQASLSVGLSRQQYWSGLPFPPPGDLPDPGIEPGSPTLQADSLPSEPAGKQYTYFTYIYNMYIYSV